MRRPFVAVLSASTWFAASACSGGDGGGTTPPPPPPTVASVAVSLAVSSIPVGVTTTATATARDAQGGTIAGKTATWSSSNVGVASVSAAGAVTGVAAGSAEITASIDGRTGSATVTVTPPPVASVTVTLSSATLTVGQSTQASAVLRDAAGAALNGRTVTWSTSNAAVATVNTTGLVTAVGPGTASITGASEGRTGSATLTATLSVTIAALSLRNADGSAADPNNIAGRLRIATDIQVPDGFRGVLELRVRGVLLRRDSLTSTSGVLARVRSTVVVDAAIAVALIDAQTLATNVLLNNGGAEAVLTAITQGPNAPPISVSRSVQINIQNMDALALVLINPRTTSILGRTWAGGVGAEAFVAHAKFGGFGDLNRIEVVRGAGGALFGAGPATGAVTVTTRTDAAARGRFALDAAEWESDASGTSWGLGSFTLGTQVFLPRSQTATLAGNAPSVDPSGLYTSPARAATLNLSASVRYQETVFQVPPGWLDVSSQVGYYDFQAAHPGPGALEPPARLETAGQLAWNPSQSWGLKGNYLGANTSFSTFLDLSKFQDAGVGPGVAADVSWYGATSLAGMFSTGNRIPSSAPLNPSNTRPYYIGGQGIDPLGRSWQGTVQTNLANPYTTGGTMSTGAQLGVTDAVFGKLPAGGSVTLSGVPTGSVFNNASALANYTVTGTATGSLYSGNAFAVTGHRYADAASCFIGSFHCMIPEVLSGTSSNNGQQVSTSWSLATVRNRWSAAGGGSGPFQLNLQGSDLGGNPIGGGIPWYGLFDFTRPTSSATVTNGTNGNVTVDATGTDDIGPEAVDYGARLNLFSPAFLGGRVFAWYHTSEVGGNLTSGLSRTVSSSVTGRSPVAGRWYNPVTGAIDRQTVIPVDGVCVRHRDWAHNASQPVCVNHSPVTPVVPVSPSLTNMRAGINAGTLCSTATCSGATPSEVIAWLEADVLVASVELFKVFMLGIPPGGEVFPMEKSETPTVMQTLPGGGRRLRWETRFTSAEYCMTLGLMLVKMMALSSDGWTVFLPSQFLSLVVVQGVGLQLGCLSPRRPLA